MENDCKGQKDKCVERFAIFYVGLCGHEPGQKNTKFSFILPIVVIFT